MRLAMVRDEHDGLRMAAVLGSRQEKVALLPESLGTVDDVVRAGAEGLAAVSAALPGCEVRDLAGVDLVAPLQRFNRDVLCVGWNFLRHFDESAGKREGQDPEKLPDHPTFFTKAPGAMIGPYDDIEFDPGLSRQWDFEAEIAIVIGKDGRSIPAGEADDHIFGFCVSNDVTQRDIQRAHGGQWMKGKSADHSTPLGPWITTPDELPGVDDLRIQCEINGERMQDGTTAAIIFPFGVVIEELSRGMTLRAGDVILTGTPSGIGHARDPQVFLTEGDVLVSRVIGLGELRNTVRRPADR